MKKSILKDKSYLFAIQIVNLSNFLKNDKKEFVISNQILKSGTSIGAMVSEAAFGQSKPDFVSKMSIALKEANETKYWLSILIDTKYISKQQYKNLNDSCGELIAMLVSSIKTAKHSK